MMIRIMQMLNIIILCVAIVGCNTAPQKYTDLKAAYSVVDVPKRKAPKKIAITEFNVEFVTGKYENLFSESQFKVPILDTIPITKFMGIGRRGIKWNEEMHRELCDLMYKECLKTLELQGHNVLPKKETINSVNYRKLAAKDFISSNFLERFNPISSDTGCIKSYKVLPTAGLKIITENSSNRTKIEAGLLDELEVDTLISVHFKVGIFRNFATIESGSYAHVIDKNSSRNIHLHNSIVSDAEVVKNSYTHPGGKSEVTLDYQKYFASVNKMLPYVVSSALNDNQPTDFHFVGSTQ